MKRKITGQISNNFTILNRNYNTLIYNLRKKKHTLYLFTYCSLFHCISLTIFSYSLYFSFLFCLLSLSLSLGLLFSLLQMVEWPYFIFLHPFFLQRVSQVYHHIFIYVAWLLYIPLNVTGLLYIIIEKEMNQFFSFGQATPANPFHFAYFSALVQQPL